VNTIKSPTAVFTLHGIAVLNKSIGNGMKAAGHQSLNCIKQELKLSQTDRASAAHTIRRGHL